MTVVLFLKARTLFLYVEFSSLETETPRWYDEAISALMHLALAVCCIIYLRYRAKLARAGQAAISRPWEDRREVRFLFYMVAAMLFLQLPMGIFRWIFAMNDHSTPFTHDAFSLFPAGAVLYPIVGAALIFYDRCRAGREERQTGNLCLACGYDVRATPDRCPECGREAPSSLDIRN